MGSHARRTVGVGVTILAILTCSGLALADAKEDAATAYDKGAAAYDKGDYPVAAMQLARADELAPNNVTLELALGAVLRTEDPVLGMTLAERAEKRKGSKALDKLAESARRRFGSRAGKLNVACKVECEVKVDGRKLGTRGSPGGWVSVGTHEVAIELGGSTQKSDVTIEAGKTVELVPTTAVAPEPKPQPAPVAQEPKVDPRPTPKPAPTSEGLSPTWFWIGLGATAVVGGVGVFSALDTASKHDEFTKDRSNADAANDGKAAEARTAILLSAAGVFAIATGILGLVLVDWKGESASSSSARAPSSGPSPSFKLTATGVRLDLGPGF